MSEPSADSAPGSAVRVTLRPIGNPLPLGFLALAGGTLTVSGLQLGWVPPHEGRDVALILIAFVFPLQLLASIFGYLARDVVAGTGMGVLAGTWLSIGLVTLSSPAGATSKALGLLLLLSFTAMLVPASAAVAVKMVPAAVLGTAALRFGVTGIYELTGSDTWKDVAGVVGLALSAIGVYAALAMALEDAGGRTVLPLGRRAQGRMAMGAGLESKTAGMAHEAGVRRQL